MKKFALIAATAALSACSLLSQKSVSGTYRGTLPCADCSKIQAELILNKDKTYQYNTVYFKNKEQHPFMEKGVYTWDEKKPNVIRLSNSGNLALHVGENHVELCDANGEMVKDSNKYKLDKVAP